MNSADKKTIVALGAIAVLGAPLIWLLKDVKAPQDVSPVTRLGNRASPAAQAPMVGANGVAVQSLNGPQIPDKPVPIEVGEAPPVPSVIADVYAPDKVKAALQTNTWLQETLKQPLGEGFVGPWAGFWGTKGEDVKAAFKGEVFGYVADQLLNAPFRVVWFGGPDSTSTPALIVPAAPGSASAAFEAINKVAQRGSQIADHCPGEKAPGTRKLEIDRWVLANQALYASMDGARLVLGRHPRAVLQGLCAKLDAPAHTAGADVDVTLGTAGLGRESQLLATLLGLGATPRLAFAIEENRLVPKGIAGELANPGRVDVAPLSDALLKTVPADAPVLLTAQLKLPQKLDAESVKAFFASKGAGPTQTRQVALLWNPRGDAKATTEVALIWSNPADAAALTELFKGPNALKHGELCGQVVLASTEALFERLQRTCGGKTPALANGPGPVVAGLRAPASIGLQFQLGKLLSNLALDGWKSEAREGGHDGAAVPKEIQAAQQQLEQLPTFGLTGTAQGQQLVAGGFHS